VFLYKVEAKVATNPKMGLGLFAKEFISKGSVVWEFVDGLDIKISMNEFNARNNSQNEHFIKYGWIQKGEENFYYSSGDLSNFMNHSYDPNINGKEEVSVALRDIHIDEELFINYKDFCFNFDETEVQE